MTADGPSPNYIDALASFAVDIRTGVIALPADLRERARHIVLDTVGAIVAGQSLPEVAALAAALDDGGSLSRLIAIGAGGVSLELDEGCAASRGHAGIHVIPPALETAARLGASGEAVLRAIVAGYEVAARLGAATRLKVGIHPHGTWGGVGGTIAVGLLEGLDTATLAQAMRIAASLAVATHYEAVDEGATVRNLWSGLANAVSVIAVRAAASGYTGSGRAPSFVFGRVLGDSFDEEVAAAGLGTDWYMLRNYFKLYSCCRHAHAPIDAFRVALGEEPPEPGAIESITIATYEYAARVVGQNHRPATPLAARFSLPYMLPVFLESGMLGPEVFEPPYLRASRFEPLSDRVRVVEDAAYTAMLPGTRAARATIRLVDGSVREAEAFGSRGDAHDPLSTDEIEAKFLRLTAHRLGPSATGLMKEILSIDARRDVSRIRDAMVGRVVSQA